LRMEFRNLFLKSSPDVIYTMRHFESEGNARGLNDKSLSNIANHKFDLTVEGCEQLEKCANYFLENKLLNVDTRIYTSNFFRAQKSIQGILDKNNWDYYVAIDSRLDEWWRGIFHSLPEESLEKHYPLEWKIQKREGKHHYRAPQGQAGKDVEINLMSFLRDAYDGEIFISGHGRSLGFLRRLITNQPVKHDCDYPIPKNGEIWKFERNYIYYKFESLFAP